MLKLVHSKTMCTVLDILNNILFTLELPETKVASLTAWQI